jgi:hypothetical protein
MNATVALGGSPDFSESEDEAMIWNYRAIKETCEGETVYQVHECYYDDKGELERWTKDAVCAQGETLTELMVELRMMVHDVGSRPALDMEELRKRFPKEEVTP